MQEALSACSCGELQWPAAPRNRRSLFVGFPVAGLDAPQPAGDYRVDHDEELVEGISRLAWRRIGAFIHLPAIAAHASMQQMVPINPADLEAALEQDLGRS